MARGCDELAAGIEEGLEARCHVVERAAEVGELTRSGVRRTGGEVAGGDRRRRPGDGRCPGDRGAEDEACRDRCGCGRCRDGEDLDVVAHVEHDPAREEDDGEREQDGEQRETDQLQPDGREEPQGDRRGESDGEREERDDERELDHGTNR